MDYYKLRQIVISDGIEEIDKSLWTIINESSGESLVYVHVSYNNLSGIEEIKRYLYDYGLVGQNTGYSVACLIAKKYPSTTNCILSNQQDKLVREILKISDGRYIVATIIDRIISDPDFLFLKTQYDYPMIELHWRFDKFDLNEESIQRIHQLAIAGSRSSARYLEKLYNKLKIRPPESIWKCKLSNDQTIVESLLDNKVFRLNPDNPEDYNKLANDSELTLAQARSGFKFESPELLKQKGVLENVTSNYKTFVPSGISPEEMMVRGILTNYARLGFVNQKIKSLIDQLELHSKQELAVTYAYYGVKLYDEYEILSYSSEHNGPKVANLLARIGYEFRDMEILLLRDPKNYNSTVAHDMAAFGYEITDKRLLVINNSVGNSVAHYMARRGYKFYDREILDLKNSYGISVEDTYNKSVEDSISRIFE